MALAPLDPETRNLVDGRLVEASSGARFENWDPATGKVLGTAADGTRDDMLAAIAAPRCGPAACASSTPGSGRRWSSCARSSSTRPARR